MNDTAADPWIGIADVVRETGLSDRAVWELLRKRGVPLLDPTAPMKRARFRLSAWREAEKQAAPLPVRAPLPPRPSATTPRLAKPSAEALDKLEQLRRA